MPPNNMSPTAQAAPFLKQGLHARMPYPTTGNPANAIAISSAGYS